MIGRGATAAARLAAIAALALLGASGGLAGEGSPSTSVGASTVAPPASPSPPDAAALLAIRVERDVPFTRRLPCTERQHGCIQLADILSPTTGGPWPTVLTVHGRPRTPRDMRPLARALARRGAVVFNIDYRGVRPVGKGFPESIEDVACAVRFARARTAEHGGDPDRVILVGHSQGGYVSALVALVGDGFPGHPGDCLVDGGDPLPQGLVHLAGVSLIDPDDPGDVDHLYFGGYPEERPRQWQRGDVYRQLGGNPDLQVAIIFELRDPILPDANATYLQLALSTAGYDTELTLLEEGNTHFDVLDMDTALGERVLGLVRALIDRTPADRLVAGPTTSPAASPVG